jgi:hypothetical protein
MGRSTISVPSFSLAVLVPNIAHLLDSFLETQSQVLGKPGLQDLLLGTSNVVGDAAEMDHSRCNVENEIVSPAASLPRLAYTSWINEVKLLLL